MLLVGPRHAPVFWAIVALFESHTAAWLGHAAALKGFCDFGILDLGI